MEDAAEKKMQKWGGEKGNFFGTVFLGNFRNYFKKSTEIRRNYI